jgi:predicted nuclease of predicted toxin-antitoxin system
MRLLANENVPLAAVRVLREAGWDVVAVSECAPSISDVEVLGLARDQKRLVATFDRDYGELIYARGHLPPSGLIYFRVVPRHPAEPATWLLEMLKQALPLEGNFTIFSGWEHVRQRRLPSP